MKIEGHQCIAGQLRSAAADASCFQAVDPRTHELLPGEFREAGRADVDAALAAAQAAAPVLRSAAPGQLAALLEGIAAQIEALGDALLERCGQETALPRARLEMERGRTCNQLRMFAGMLAGGSHLDLCIEHGDPARTPIPKPDLRRMLQALGPVVVFGASNFPLAFSVAGGDTAAALAAGCPVVVKAHPAHPGTSELMARAIQAAVAAAELPGGTFSMLQSREHQLAAELVQHPGVEAVAFTGSLAGGRAIFDLCQGRAVPIPCFAEMGSSNPVFALAGSLTGEGAVQLAQALVASIQMGVGQFCTSPGLLVYPEGADGLRMEAALAELCLSAGPGVMLHRGIATQYDARLRQVRAGAGVSVLTQVEAPEVGTAGVCLLKVGANDFLAQPQLQEEIFGPATLLVPCTDAEQMLLVAENLAGQLTATMHAGAGDEPEADALSQVLARRVGRLLFGGMPTGVEVNAAMQHGGPYPASTDLRSTSVGAAAIDRFLRPICFQNYPDALLPPALQEANPLGFQRLVDGRHEGSA